MLHESLKRVTGNCTFVCKSQFAIRNMLFAENIEAKDIKHGVVRFHLKREMLELNMCSVEKQVGEKLQKLATCTYEQVVINDESMESKSKEIKEKPKSMEVEWKQLSKRSSYVGKVTEFKNPESFLMVMQAGGNKTAQSFMLQLEDYETAKPLGSFDIGTICGVQREKLRRGQIVAINDDGLIDVLLVDLGEIVTRVKKDLIEIPDELVTKLPFQAVHCRMVGVRPKYNMQTWPPKQCDAVEELLQGSLKVYVLDKNTVQDELTDCGMNTYNVILIDEKGEFLDELAVAKCIVDRADYEKPDDLDEFVDSGVQSEEDRQEDLELLKKLLEHNYNREGFTTDEEEDNEIPVEQPEIILRIDEPEIDQQESNLNYIHKQPKIEWRQNDMMIYILISAPDCEDYGLTIDEFSMKIVISYKDDRYEQALIDFYGTINAKDASHELRGLNIIVRLMKQTPRQDWPRLTESKDKSQFIKFSTEKISTKLEEEMLKALTSQGGASKYASGVPSGFEEIPDQENSSQSEYEDCDLDE